MRKEDNYWQEAEKRGEEEIGDNGKERRRGEKGNTTINITHNKWIISTKH